jgi:hypothetical protein
MSLFIKSADLYVIFESTALVDVLRTFVEEVSVVIVSFFISKVSLTDLLS